VNAVSSSVNGLEATKTALTVYAEVDVQRLYFVLVHRLLCTGWPKKISHYQQSWLKLY